MSDIKPGLGYVYGEEVKEESGAVVSTAISDTRQRYKVLAIGYPEVHVSDKLRKIGISYVDYISFKIGDTVLIQKHAAEGDTPSDMLSKGFALFQANRVMAVMDE